MLNRRTFTKALMGLPFVGGLFGGKEEGLSFQGIPLKSRPTLLPSGPPAPTNFDEIFRVESKPDDVQWGRKYDIKTWEPVDV